MYVRLNITYVSLCTVCVCVHSYSMCVNVYVCMYTQVGMYVRLNITYVYSIYSMCVCVCIHICMCCAYV